MAFEWIQCSFFLKKVVEDSEITINLTPYHKLMVMQQVTVYPFRTAKPRTSSLKSTYSLSDPWITLRPWAGTGISLGRSPTSESPWTYRCDHSARPPLLHQTADQHWQRLCTYALIQAEICAVKPVISKEYSLCVEDIGLDGNSILRIQNNTCLFSGLKFAGTSYNCEVNSPLT